MAIFKQETIDLIKETVRNPKLVIDCFGDAYAKEIWSTFNERHPNFPLMRRKTFGAAMREIPSREQILDGPQFATTRRAVRKAEKAGYTFRSMRAADYFEQIIAVNRSSEERQGRPISLSYTDLKQVEAYNAQPGDWYGVFDKNGQLQAYTHVPIFGDAFLFSRILGNRTFLNDGIMHLLVAETLRVMGEKRDAAGHPNWAMYDMLIGAGAGLREFKRRTGFHPRRVRWRWINR